MGSSSERHAQANGLSDRVPAREQQLETVRDVIGALIDHLDLHDVTLVMHDLGGVTALAAASTRMDRIAAIAAINTFAWRPSGIMFRSMLWIIGLAPMREFDAFTCLIPNSTSTRFGVGRHLDRPSRKAFRRGLRDRSTRRNMHRLFRDARRNTTIYDQAAATMGALGKRPALTLFGSLGDYLRFQKRWRRLVPGIEQRRVPRGIHFPMCDNPTLTAQHIREWHHSITG
jgi:pimeloyl-ACP methyl ester carboxylesterase